MQNYKLLIEYDGSRYYGWQRLPDQVTIQGKLESVLGVLCGHEVEVIGAGRTDAGVHARGMVANAVLDTDLEPDGIRDYLNRYLPDDIAVLDVKEASARFHARYNAIGKTYCYTCYDGAVKPVFDRKYYYATDAGLDVKRMRSAARLLIGTHDFRNFCVNPKMKKSTMRNIDRIDIERDGGYLRFTYHGSGFLRNMVRILTGTLLEIGYGRMTEQELTEILETDKRRKAGPTAPAQGLCLMRVDYD